MDATFLLSLLEPDSSNPSRQPNRNSPVIRPSWRRDGRQTVCGPMPK
jgi:hypothetical protein